VVVTGVVGEVQNNGRTILITDQTKRLQLAGHFNPDSPTVKERGGPHRVGDKVRVLGTSLSGDLAFQFCEDLSEGR
jgi:hypothetical protein